MYVGNYQGCKTIQRNIVDMTQDDREIANRVSLTVTNCLASVNISVWFWWDGRYKGETVVQPGRSTKFNTNHGDKWQATVAGENKTVQSGQLTAAMEPIALWRFAILRMNSLMQ